MISLRAKSVLESGTVVVLLLAYAGLLSAIEDHCLVYGSSIATDLQFLSDCPVVMTHIDLRYEGLRLLRYPQLPSHAEKTTE
ncbi:hypothetical protein LB503_011602 [Fusarium chuoi]|nr:hypothetical protein LB503_011602 [Fusarium chuoi]